MISLGRKLWAIGFLLLLKFVIEQTRVGFVHSSLAKRLKLHAVLV